MTDMEYIIDQLTVRKTGGYFNWTYVGDNVLLREPDMENPKNAAHERWLARELPSYVHICHPKELAACVLAGDKDGAVAHSGYIMYETEGGFNTAHEIEPDVRYWCARCDTEVTL